MQLPTIPINRPTCHAYEATSGTTDSFGKAAIGRERGATCFYCCLLTTNDQSSDKLFGHTTKTVENGLGMQCSPGLRTLRQHTIFFFYFSPGLHRSVQPLAAFRAVTHENACKNCFSGSVVPRILVIPSIGSWEALTTPDHHTRPYQRQSVTKENSPGRGGTFCSFLRRAKTKGNANENGNSRACIKLQRGRHNSKCKCDEPWHAGPHHTAIGVTPCGSIRVALSLILATAVRTAAALYLGRSLNFDLHGPGGRVVHKQRNGQKGIHSSFCLTRRWRIEKINTPREEAGGWAGRVSGG